MSESCFEKPTLHFLFLQAGTIKQKKIRLRIGQQGLFPLPLLSVIASTFYSSNFQNGPEGLYRPGTLDIHHKGDLRSKILVPEAKIPEKKQEGQLIIFKGLASGEHFSGMNQEQAITINRILVK